VTLTIAIVANMGVDGVTLKKGLSL